MKTADFLVVGGGVVGVTAALEIKRRQPGARVVLVEKESSCGQHASSRNSGVLHAGFYYAADSLKARFTVEGNRRMTAYCEEKGLPINRCGKLVVARSPDELPVLEELARRGTTNGCRVELISECDVHALDSRVRTCGQALFSPTTSSVDPKGIMASLTKEADVAGIQIRTGIAYRGACGNRVTVGQEQLEVGHLINAAGLHADRVARDFGFGESFAIVPFKGLYLTAEQGTEPLKCHVYPVPDLANQFHLGLHFTVTVHGGTKIGPTAIPAVWREQYSGFENFRFGDAVDVFRQQAALWWRNDFGFRRLALQEVQKYSRRRVVKLVSSLVPDVNERNYRKWGVPGIRAQLFDVRKQTLVLDFKVEGDDRSTHVLNAVSPAFTCCFPFASYLIDRVEAAARN